MLFTVIKTSRLSYYSSYTLQKVTDMWTGKSVRRTDKRDETDKYVKISGSYLSCLLIPS